MMKKTISLLLTVMLIFAVSLSALAAEPNGGPADRDKGGKVEVNGKIGVEKVSYKITYSAKVNWYVTENSYPNVWNGITKDTANPNIIKNDSNSMEYSVTLKNITQTNADAKTVAKNLKLYLTGNLVEKPLSANTNISGGWSVNRDNMTAYTGTLIPGKDWSYGFTGTYDTWLNSKTYTPTYTMNLSFALAPGV